MAPLKSQDVLTANTLELQSIVFIYVSSIAMLITNDRYEVTDHPYWLNQGQRMWRLIDMELQVPYFLISYDVREGDCWCNQTALLWRLNDLLGFFHQILANENERVRQVAMLIPSATNPKDGWEMNNIREIWTARDPKDKHTVVTYVTQNGRRYQNHPSSTSEDELEEREMVLSFTAIERHP